MQIGDHDHLHSLSALPGVGERGRSSGGDCPYYSAEIRSKLQSLPIVQGPNKYRNWLSVSGENCDTKRKCIASMFCLYRISTETMLPNLSISYIKHSPTLEETQDTKLHCYIFTILQLCGKFSWRVLSLEAQPITPTLHKLKDIVLKPRLLATSCERTQREENQGDKRGRKHW